jgi:hypothetical protein
VVIELTNFSVEVVRFCIRGGVGAVPICFENVPSLNWSLFWVADNGIEKDMQTTSKRRDCWQTDFDASSKKFNFVFNPLFDKILVSTWVFRSVD